MTERLNDPNVQIDARTNREITRGIGEALRRSFAPEPSEFSDRIQGLLDALKAQDERHAADRGRG